MQIQYVLAAVVSCAALVPVEESLARSVTIIESPPQVYAVLVGARDGKIRGDRNVAAMESALRRYSGVAPQNILTASTLSGIDAALSTIGGIIRPRDSFVFYYGGHGNSTLTDKESRVYLTPEATAADPHHRTFELGDETVNLRGQLPFTDDALAEKLRLFNNHEQVRKLVILDSCFGGGFWGESGVDMDVGDLKDVANTAILSSAAEGEISYASRFSGKGLMTIALEGVLREDPGLGGLSYAHLKEKLTTRYANENYEDTIGFVQAEGDIEMRIGQLSLFGAANATFDANAMFLPAHVQPVPLPTAAWGGMLLLGGLGVGKRFRSRTRSTLRL